MRIISLSIMLVSFLSCSPEQGKDRNIGFTIKYAQSYIYDLNNCILTVFRHGGSTEIKFKLLSGERKAIIDKYYELEIDKINGVNREMKNIYIDDKCMLMPKLYTFLKVKTKDSFQEIQIDEECNEFYYSNEYNAKKIKRFLKFTIYILESKPEIKYAPKSDSIYM